jgi:DNA uptake protein ComE-like DNA-binding protein
VGSANHTNGNSPDAWLIDEPSSRPRKVSEAAPKSPKAQQWLIEPTGDSEQPIEDGSPPVEAEHLPSESRNEIAELRMRVEDLESELEEQLKQTDIELATQLKQHEKQKLALERRFSDREAELRGRIDSLESELAEARSNGGSKSKAGTGRKSKSPAPAANGRVHLNEVSFEELRDLGLSVTQSARVIAYRDVRGGYGSLDEIDEVPGLPKDTRRLLREQLTIER